MQFSRAVLAFFSGSLLVGCTGTISSEGTDRARATGGMASTGATGGNGASGGEAGGPGGGQDGNRASVGPAQWRRLSGDQYVKIRQGRFGCGCFPIGPACRHEDRTVRHQHFACPGNRGGSICQRSRIRCGQGRWGGRGKVLLLPNRVCAEKILNETASRLYRRKLQSEESKALLALFDLVSAVGMASQNAGGNVTLSFSVVTTPNARPVHVVAVVNLSNGNGSWTDSGGSTGAMVFQRQRRRLAAAAGAGDAARPERDQHARNRPGRGGYRGCEHRRSSGPHHRHLPHGPGDDRREREWHRGLRVDHGRRWWHRRLLQGRRQRDQQLPDGQRLHARAVDAGDLQRGRRHVHTGDEHLHRSVRWPLPADGHRAGHRLPDRPDLLRRLPGERHDERARLQAGYATNASINTDWISLSTTVQLAAGERR